MAAFVRDIRIVDVEGLAYFEFDWRADDSTEWRGALEDLKGRVDLADREFIPEAKRWRVSCAYEDVLAEIFPNFEGALVALRSQGELFGEET